MRSFLLAWHFLTAIPLGTSQPTPTPRDLARSMRWYPVIGFLLGGALVGLDRTVSGVTSPAVVAALLLTAVVGLTRGLHQDGLADTADGFFGGQTPQERLAIMRDPRIGAFGATALVLSLLLRYAGLLALLPAVRLPVLLCLPALGRWAMVIGAKTAPYARKEGGLAEPFLTELRWGDLAWATVAVLIGAVGAMGPWRGVACVGLAAALGIGLAALARRLCGGVTGDTLGGTNEVVEIALLLLAPVVLSGR